MSGKLDSKISISLMRKERAKPENKHCADCSAVGPEWISIRFGVIICLNCSGVHRGFGAKVSFVQSSTLDSLKMHVIEQYQTLNNRIMNGYYERNMPSGVKPIAPTTPAKVSVFIKNKYIRKKWVDEGEDDPVVLYQDGEYEKAEERKKEKKEKKEKNEKRRKEKKEKKRRKEEAKAIEEQPQTDLIDFGEEDSSFTSFQEPILKTPEISDTPKNLRNTPSPPHPSKPSSPSNFPTTISPPLTTPSTTTSSPFDTPSPLTHLTQNLTYLYNQSPPTPAPVPSKYSALESLPHFYPQNTQFTQNSQNSFPGHFQAPFRQNWPQSTFKSKTGAKQTLEGNKMYLNGNLGGGAHVKCNTQNYNKKDMHTGAFKGLIASQWNS